jgi:hypothetical protein
MNQYGLSFRTSRIENHIVMHNGYYFINTLPYIYYLLMKVKWIFLQAYVITIKEEKMQCALIMLPQIKTQSVKRTSFCVESLYTKHTPYILGSASCCEWFMKVIRKTILRNNCSRHLLYKYKYNKCLEQLLQGTVFMITLTLPTGCICNDLIIICWFWNKDSEGLFTYSTELTLINYELMTIGHRNQEVHRNNTLWRYCKSSYVNVRYFA